MIVKLDPEDKIIVRNSFDLYKVMKKILMRETKIEREQEHVWVVSLSKVHRIKVVELVSLGSINEAILVPMQVFRIPMLKGAFAVILVHNHDENLEPSKGDLNITDQMIKAGEFFEVKVLDHLIINERNFLSFKRRGLMEELKNSKKWVPSYLLEEEAKKIGEKIGEKKGLRKGKKVGKKIGLEEGVKKGKKETAKKMLKKRFDIDTIVELTGLKKHEIEKLVKTPAPKPKIEHNP
jgi:DNA repair protein RadC